jgi:hypothetical protein
LPQIFRVGNPAFIRAQFPLRANKIIFFFVFFAFLSTFARNQVFSSASNKSFFTLAKNLIFLKEQKNPPLLAETPLFSQRFMKKKYRVKPTVGLEMSLGFW